MNSNTLGASKKWVMRALLYETEYPILKIHQIKVQENWYKIAAVVEINYEGNLHTTVCRFEFSGDGNGETMNASYCMDPEKIVDSKFVLHTHPYQRESEEYKLKQLYEGEGSSGRNSVLGKSNLIVRAGSEPKTISLHNLAQNHMIKDESTISAISISEGNMWNSGSNVGTMCTHPNKRFSFTILNENGGLPTMFSAK
jgi:hypothetical protein